MISYVRVAACPRKLRLVLGFITGVLIIWLLHQCLGFFPHTQSSKDNVEPSAEDKVKLSLLRENSLTSLSALTDGIMEGMSVEQLRLTFLTVIDNTEVVCSRRLRFGKIADGGWDICDDLSVRPGENCVVYSFGIGNDFSFDDMVAKLYGCHVFSFDPSMEAATHNRSSLVHFYKLGIAGKTNVLRSGWNMYTLRDLRTMLNHAHTVIDVIKMDVEGSEWEALPEMLASGALRGVRQLLVEFHLLSDQSDYNNRVTMLGYLKIVKHIHDAGFRVFYPHKNQYKGWKLDGFPATTTLCFEVHFMNTNPVINA